VNYSEIIRFHGHTCPGLAIGYRLASAALEALNAVRSADEEIVAIVENDACGVDAVQCLTGCTFGKGNLKFRDYGKQVYTLYSRPTGKGVRVVYHGNGIPAALHENRSELADYILQAPDGNLFSLTHVSIEEPEPARIRKSASCARCRESVMETRLQTVNGQLFCIPCAESQAESLSADAGNR
jgi:formylmethanofuran dehydrogenase subunit E